MDTPTQDPQPEQAAQQPQGAPPLDVLILAAGLGTRMRSGRAKVLHKLGGRPLIARVCSRARALVKGDRPVYVVVGHQAAEVEAAVLEELGEGGAVFVTQTEQRGTGDAVMAARAALGDADSTLLVLSGDVPFARAETLGALVRQHRTHRGHGAASTLLAVRLEDPTGYGRVVRDSDGLFERILRARTLRKLMLDAGVTVVDPAHTYVSPEAQIGRDTVVHPGVVVEGRTEIGEACELYPGVRVTNSRIGSGVTIKDHSVVVDSEIADNCSVGPFAHLRMQAQMEEGAAVGNFVEVKKSRLGREGKAMHLTHPGDATLGDRPNGGAGP